MKDPPKKLLHKLGVSIFDEVYQTKHVILTSALSLDSSC